MIVYLVAPTYTAGVDEAQRRGWYRLAVFRFATPGRHDVRIITRPGELDLLPGVTVMMRTGWREGPPKADSVACQAWPIRKAAFELVVLQGWGRWVDDPDEVGDTGGPSATPPATQQAF